MANDYIKNYYGASGEYLFDHRSFLDSANLEFDTSFIILALKLEKGDRILDIACGQGRHTNYFADKGYHIDGTDFSEHLIQKARSAAAKSETHVPEYFISDVMNLNLPTKYNKAYWFFSDLAGIDIGAAIKSIGNNIEAGGMVLFDTDNIFRIISYLLKNPDSEYTFDATESKLVDEKRDLNVPYPTLQMWKQWLEKYNFSIENIFGDYNFGEYSIYSPRLIIVVKKTA